MNDPKPGTADATKQGCACPVMDNHHGAGRYGRGEQYGWFVSAACALHGKAKTR